jgi:hypothetical protein
VGALGTSSDGEERPGSQDLNGTMARFSMWLMRGRSCLSIHAISGGIEEDGLTTRAEKAGIPASYASTLEPCGRDRRPIGRARWALVSTR